MDSDRVVFPRVTKAYAKSLIVKERMVVDHEMCIVVCMVKLVNGHRLTAEAIVANNSSFDPEKGETIAREKVIDKIINLEMYNLRSKLHEHKLKEASNDAIS